MIKNQTKTKQKTIPINRVKISGGLGGQMSHIINGHLEINFF